MKLLVIGLDCAAPELLFGDDQLVNLRRLMDAGSYGRLESVIPPITIPAWMCMSTSRDPGTLGIYGFRNRADWSYDRLSTVNSKSFTDLAIWDQVAREGKRAHVIGVPPSFPPRKTSGYSVGCFLTPDTAANTFTRPENLGGEIRALLGEDYRVDVRGFRTENKDWLKDEILTMTRQHFQVIRHVMQTTEWDYLQFVEIGLDRMHHGFWKYQDARHRHHVPGNPYQHIVRDYYRMLDAEIGSLLELLDDDTAVLVLSDHGAQRLEGGFCVNEWLIEQGLLVLNQYPEKPTSMSDLDVNWDRTTAWSEGGYYARVFMNVKDREPHGTISPQDYERVRNDLKARFETTRDDRGRVMANRISKPQEIYKEVRNLPPDLIVHFDNLFWRSVGKVGYRALHLQENDTGPDDCNHAQFGAFILAAPGCPPKGAMENVRLLDLTPTLLELAGYDPLPGMQGKSILNHPTQTPGTNAGASATDQEIIRERLSGLGYI